MVDFSYDPSVDILTVDIEGRRAEEYDSSRAVGDYAVDLSEDGNVLGIEVLNASQNLPFTQEELKNIDYIELEASKRGGAITVSVNVTYSGNKGKFSFGYGARA